MCCAEKLREYIARVPELKSRSLSTLLMLVQEGHKYLQVVSYEVYYDEKATLLWLLLSAPYFFSPEKKNVCHTIEDIIFSLFHLLAENC